MSFTDDIRDFHEKFGLNYDGPPRILDADQQMLDLRVKRLQEEVDEYKQAVLEGDLEGQFDALIDTVYIALGTAYLQGLPFNEGWDEVHGANMRKERGDKKTSKYGNGYDIVKPRGWEGPDLLSILEYVREQKTQG